MFLVSAWKGLLVMRYLCNNARPLRIASIGVDAAKLCFIAVSKGGVMKDGLLGHLEGRGVLLPQPTEERDTWATVRFVHLPARE